MDTSPLPRSKRGETLCVGDLSRMATPMCIICHCVYQAESSAHLHITLLDVLFSFKKLAGFNCKEPASNDQSYYTGPVLQTWALIGHKKPTEPLHN